MNDTAKAPKLRDCNGSIYNPRKALHFFELLAAGATNLVRDERLIKTIRRALVAQYPLEPEYDKGRNGKKYDRYFCGNCGFGVTESFYNYCPNCGQRLTDAYAGGRKTQADQETYWED